MLICDHQVVVNVESVKCMYTNSPTNQWKTLFFSPPRILHQGGYTKEEQMEFRSIIFGNILQSALAIIRGMEMLDIQFGSPAAQVCQTTPKTPMISLWTFTY